MTTTGIIGVDTIRVAFTGFAETVDASWMRKLPGGGTLSTRGDRVMVEASLASHVYGNNVKPLPVGLLGGAVADLVQEAREGFDVDDRELKRDRLRITRIDIVRDFSAVTELPTLLFGLASIRQPRDPAVLQWGRRRRGVQTLLVKFAKSWSIELYDKCAESRGAAPQGQVRCEVRMRSRKLRSPWAIDNGGAVRVIGDVTEDRLHSLAKATWDRAGFGSLVSAPDELCRRVMNLGDVLSGSQQTSLLGHLLLVSNGFASPLSDRTVRAYERLARDHDLRLGGSSTTTTIGLDWTTGMKITSPTP